MDDGGARSVCGGDDGGAIGERDRADERSWTTLQVVLVNGRFESAEGFSISSDKRTASMVSRDATRNESEEPAVTLRLKWKGGA